MANPVTPDTPTREPMAGEMPEAVVYREWTRRALNSLRFLRQIARANGYAAAVHGSLMRDLDVVCVPWTEEAVSPDDLVEKIAKMMSDEDCPVYVTKKLMADKPHGRLSTVLHFKNEPFSYIDLSVMPVAALPPAPPAEPTGVMRAKIIAALEAADGWNPDAVSDDPRAHRAMVEEYERIADVVMGHLWPSDSAPFAAPLPSGEPTSEAVERREGAQVNAPTCSENFADNTYWESTPTAGEAVALLERVEFWRRAWHALDADNRRLHDDLLAFRRGTAPTPPSVVPDAETGEQG